MAGEIITPNMSLPTPGVGSTSGPQYATDVNACMSIIDGHNHTSGSGVPIPTAGININSNLTLNNYSLINVAALTLTAQLSAPSNQSVYVSGVDLYYIDGNGNSVRITQGGSVTGSAGTITGLPSGTASASYASSTFVFQAATNTAATIDGASFILRNTTASSHGLTLSPPNAMAANYQLFLPTIPASVTSIMQLDTSGNMSAVLVVDNSTLQISSNTLQVKAGGITATQIANGTITATQIASGTITGTQLANNINIPGPGITLNSKQPVITQVAFGSYPCIIVGEVSLTGTIQKGQGFTVARLGGGVYTISFTTTYGGPPTVVAGSATTNGTAVAYSASSSSLTIQTYVSGSAQDAAFSFIAIGLV